MKHVIPPAILAQHVAVLGKTGSGKTSTAKLAIEQVVAEGARVCVLDPIKSDWWGLTSSANGKHAGLPFHILGGPHGHVPLHSAAGKAVADVVASGALPLSIVDMADLEPGGQAKFFVDFAPTLLRKMRGVVYLVIEEAHLFAPKERSGFDKENLSIHWAKTMATAGRSKGVRLVLVTQRTQALHNALLGSCDTLIAHRLTAPADQEPVVKWLKANTTKEVLEEVASSLASLQTGDGWICSGEAKLFERRHFPRIATYDNTATPTTDGKAVEIKTAPVDADKLRTLIGEAVDQAKAEDPRELRRQVAALRQEVETLKRAQPPTGKVEIKTVEQAVLKDGQLARAEAILDRVEKLIEKAAGVAQEFGATVLAQSLQEAGSQIADAIAATRAPQREPPAERGIGAGHSRPVRSVAVRPAPVPRVSPLVGDGTLTGPELKILRALAELRALGLYPADKRQLGFLAGYTNIRSGGFSEPFSRLNVGGYIVAERGKVEITEAGVREAGDVEAPQTSAELQERILAKLTGPEQKLLKVLLQHYPAKATKEWLGEQCGYTNIRSGGFSEPISHLNVLGLIESSRGEVAASRALFLEDR